MCQSVHQGEPHHHHQLFAPNAFIKLVIVKKLKIESLTQTRLIFGRTQLAEANLSATELGPIDKVFFLEQDFLFASNLYLVLD